MRAWMQRVIGWIERHAPVVQALTAIITMLIAIGALVGVKVQIDAAERMQREQSARDIYREFLNLSIAKPEFSSPDYCAIAGTPQEPAYEAYVDYLLYTAEQAIAADEDWEPTFARALGAHAAYLCSSADWSEFDPDVQQLIRDTRRRHCAAVRPCS